MGSDVVVGTLVTKGKYEFTYDSEGNELNRRELTEEEQIKTYGKVVE